MGVYGHLTYQKYPWSWFTMVMQVVRGGYVGGPQNKKSTNEL